MRAQQTTVKLFGQITKLPLSEALRVHERTMKNRNDAIDK